MKEPFSFLRGSVLLRVQGQRPERLLNLLTASGVRFWSLQKPEADTLRFYVARDRVRRAEKLCQTAGLACTREGRRGFSALLGRLKKRYLLLTLPILCVLATLYLSLLVWDIEVTGNVQVSRAAVVDAVQRAGLKLGTFTLTVDRELVRSRVIAQLPELSWVSIHINGSRVRIDVRERRPKPDIVDASADRDVTAAKSGMIISLNVLQGKPLVKVGDTVLAGEKLVSGTMDSSVGDTRYVHAQAEVYARTWYELSASMPLRYTTKRYTGETQSKTAVTLGNLRLNLYLDAGVPTGADKSVHSRRLELPFGIVLPISLEEVRYELYEEAEAELRPEAAQAELEQVLSDRLRQLAPEAEIRSAEFSATSDGHCVTVTLLAECSERIDVETPLTPGENASTDAPT